MSLLGEVFGEGIQLCQAGEIARDCWLDIPLHSKHVFLDAYIVMPDYVHGILLFLHSVPIKNAGPGQHTRTRPLIKTVVCPC